MAQDWCLAYGVLPEERAKKLYNQVCNRKNIKVEKVSTSTISNTASAQKPSARGGRGKARTDLDVEADTGLGDGDVWESNGRKGI